MRVLLVSSCLSSRLQERLYRQYGLSAGFAAQKYYKMLEEGLTGNGVAVETLSVIPIPRKQAPFVFRRFTSETEQGVRYRYIPFIRFAPLYHTFLLLRLLRKVFWWSLWHRREGVVLCDVLMPAVCVGSSLGAGLAGIRRIALATDMPWMDSDRALHYKELNIWGKWQMRRIPHFSAFVVLTKETDAKLNLRGKPSVVIEGFVPSGSPAEAPHDTVARDTRTVFYAGGLNEKYGIGCLCEAFMRLEQPDIRLVLYGEGPYVEKLRELQRQDPRIEYRGTASNETVMAAERAADLLVNPRFSGEEYTFYSFPSKNLEYMASGTPLVTTRLKGLPEDHLPYIYTFDEESVGGYASTLSALLSLPREVLAEKGAAAREWVLATKNARVQVARIIRMAEALNNPVRHER